MAAQNPDGSWLTSWRSLRALAGVFLSLLAVGLALKMVDLSHLQTAFRQVEIWGILLAFLSVGVNNLAKGARWFLMLGGKNLSFGSTFLLHLQGQLWNLVYPVRLGDLGRALLLQNFQKSASGGVAGNPGTVAFALGTVTSEKILDTFAYVLMVAIVFARIPLPPWLNRTSFLIATGLAGFALLALIALWRIKKLRVFELTNVQIGIASRFRELATAFINGILLSFETTVWPDGSSPGRYFRAWLRPLGMFLLTGLIWLTALFNNYLVLASINVVPVQLPESQAWDAGLLILVVLVAGLNLPALPLRIGLFEYVCILSLNVFGISDEIALVFGLILHIVTMLPIIVGGLVAGLFSMRTLPGFVLTSAGGKSAPAVQPPGSQPEEASRYISTGDQTLLDIRRVKILGITITAAPMETILQLIASWTARQNQLDGSNGPRLVGYANAHTLNSAHRDPVVREYMQRADLIYADGISVTWAAHFLHQVRAPKMTGRMWVRHLASLASQQSLRIFLLGGKPGIAAEAGRRLQAGWPQIQIVGEQDGFFPALQTPVLLDKIHKAQPDILLVGMGSPRQETWVLEHLAALNVPICWVVGALFDYLAGRERPAPEWLSAAGLEWFWRLVLNPLGKWRRYLLGIPLFMFRIVRQKMSLLYRK